MGIRKIILLCLVLYAAFLEINAKKISIEITPAEERTFTDEADDFIDDLPEGGQDWQSDAINHAIWGNTSALKQLRDMASVSKIKVSDNVNIKDLDIADNQGVLKLRVYRPVQEQKNLPLLVFFHPGGWCVGGLSLSDGFCSSLSEKGNVVVLSVDYGLSPENNFAKSLSDCFKGIEYAYLHAEELGCDKNKISIGGDGAGSNLAVSLFFATNNFDNSSQNSGEKINIKSLILFNPMINTRMVKTDSWKKYSRGFGFDGRVAENLYQLHADNTSFKDEFFKSIDLPPVLVIYAERDILFDESKEFINLLDCNGVEITDVVLKGAVHGFLVDGGQPTAFKKAVDLTDWFLTK